MYQIRPNLLVIHIFLCGVFIFIGLEQKSFLEKKETTAKQNTLFIHIIFLSFLLFSFLFYQLLVLFSNVTFTPSVKLSWTALLSVSVQGSVHCPSLLCVVVTDRHILTSVLFK